MGQLAGGRARDLAWASIAKDELLGSSLAR